GGLTRGRRRKPGPFAVPSSVGRRLRAGRTKLRAGSGVQGPSPSRSSRACGDAEGAAAVARDLSPRVEPRGCYDCAYGAAVGARRIDAAPLLRRYFSLRDARRGRRSISIAKSERLATIRPAATGPSDTTSATPLAPAGDRRRGRSF